MHPAFEAAERKLKTFTVQQDSVHATEDGLMRPVSKLMNWMSRVPARAALAYGQDATDCRYFH